MKKVRSFKTNSSGQLLILAALAVAILIGSTTVYVYELGKQSTGAGEEPMDNFILSAKLNTRNAVIASLANVSNGGEKTVLTSNLDVLSQVFTNLSSFRMCTLSYALLNDSMYDSGLSLSWNSNGKGVSSANSDFTLSLRSMATTIDVNYTVNITSAITIDCNYTRLLGDEKLVNLTCRVYNEGEPSLAKNISLSYQDLGNWTPIDSSSNLSVMDYGNGTYAISFTINTPSNEVQISTHLYDLRGIFVQANTTCSEA